MKKVKTSPVLSAISAILRWLPILLLTIISGAMLVNMLAQLPALFETQRKIYDAKIVVETADHEVQRLRAAREFARTDMFIELWARSQANWARPGENIVAVPGAGLRSADWLSEFRID